MKLPLSYNWRNLFVRKLSTTLTFTVVAVVVFVLCVLLSFAEGINESLKASGSPLNIIVLKPGSTAESTSVILPDEANKLPQAPGIAINAAGEQMIAHEICVQSSLRRKPTGNLANVGVRGVTHISFQVHDDVKLTEGRMFAPGAMEVIVGKAARERYENLQIGGEVPIGRLSNRFCKVVGTFESGGSALESEIWAPLTLLNDAFGRRYMSSALIRMQDPSAAQAAIDYINGPAVNLESKRERDYYKELSKTTREIVVLTTILITIMAIGAMFAVANTMYAAVDGRRREIAMLRTIGFKRRSIIASFLIESLLICGTACLFGLVLSYVAVQFFFNASKQDFLSDVTWTALAYELRITPGVMLTALILAGAVAVFGAVAPAMRAARTQVIEALRKA